MNESLWREIGSTIGEESRALVKSGGMRFTPDINLFRDPRWGRCNEGQPDFPKELVSPPCHFMMLRIGNHRLFIVPKPPLAGAQPPLLGPGGW